MKISLNDEWQELVEEHKQETENRKRANSRQNLFLFCAMSLMFFAVLISLGFFVHFI